MKLAVCEVVWFGLLSITHAQQYWSNHRIDKIFIVGLKVFTAVMWSYCRQRYSAFVCTATGENSLFLHNYIIFQRYHCSNFDLVLFIANKLQQHSNICFLSCSKTQIEVEFRQEEKSFKINQNMTLIAELFLCFKNTVIYLLWSFISQRSIAADNLLNVRDAERKICPDFKVRAEISWTIWDKKVFYNNGGRSIQILYSCKSTTLWK